MSRDETDLKAMFKMASQVLKDNTTLKVPEAMRLAKFTLMESKDRKLYTSAYNLFYKTRPIILNNVKIYRNNKCLL